MARMHRLIATAVAFPMLMAAQPASPTGRWVGSGTLTNTWTLESDAHIALRCEYIGKMQPPAITLSLPSAAAVGDLILDFPPPTSSCPPLRKRFQFRAQVSAARITFIDAAGDRWTLAMTGDLLTGDILWVPEPDMPGEALAVGFTYQPPLRPWDVPLTRLSGKVTLRRVMP